MDSLISAAARALAAGDVLGALNRVALRGDPPALALRGIAMARLGDFARARTLLRNAARAFGAREPLARARCIVAEAEVALASRDLGGSARALEAARATLEAHGDHANAAHARLLAVRHLLLIGRLDAADRLLAPIDPAPLPPALRATQHLVTAGIALRRLRTQAARDALSQAQRAAQEARIPALIAEVESAARLLDAPAARLMAHGSEDRLLKPAEVEALFAGDALIVDACQHAVRRAGQVVPLASRPVLFTLARALAEAWPGDVSRDALVARAFRARRADESYRARLRVEIGRLRSLLRGMAGVHATPQGFALHAQGGEVLLLAPPVEAAHGAVLALLADGEAWSSSALALALDASQRTVQRALDALAAQGQAQPVGQGRARRWTIASPLAGIATALLLPAPLPGG